MGEAKAAGSLVDLFCGCGGFSLGAELAGFRSLAAIDIDPTLQSAYRRNFPRTQAIEGDLSRFGPENWRHYLGKIRPDGVIGGPPCQGFSWIGKKRSDDPRNSLVGQFFQHVATLRPRFFIMENVEGILHEANAKLLFEAATGLSTTYRILDPTIINATDYGAATSRRRVVVIGYDPNEMDEISATDFELKTPAPRVTVRDAISDLPTPIGASKDALDFGWAKYPPSSASAYATGLRQLPPSGLGDAGACEQFRQGMVSGMVATRHRSDIQQRYASIEGGKSDPITKSFKLQWDGRCPTLRAGTGSDRGAFQAVRPLHPSEGRVITVREAARLQGFPDWFTFHPTKWHSFRMIGNSVSPLVSQGLMRRFAERLSIDLAA